MDSTSSIFLTGIRADRPFVTELALYTILYCIMRLIMMSVSAPDQPGILVWLPGGVAALAVLRLGYSGVLVPFVGVILVPLHAHTSLVTILADVLGEAAEATVFLWLLRQQSGFSTRFQRLEDVWSLLLAACLSAALCSNIDLLNHEFSGNNTSGSYLQAWMDVWYGHALGIMLITPVLLAWTEKRASGEHAEAASLTLSLWLYVVMVASALVAFLDFGTNVQFLSQQRSLIVIPPLVWAVTRFPLREAMTALLLLNSVVLLAIYTPVSVQSALSYGQLFFLLSMVPLLGLSISASAISIKRTVQALRESNTRLSTLIESLPDGIIFKDGVGRLQVMNEIGQQILSLSGNAWQGKTYQDMADTTPQMQMLLEARLARDEEAYLSHGLYVYEEQVTGLDGRTRNYEVRKLPRFHADGGRAGLVVVMRDITEAKRSHIALEKNKDKLRDLVVIQQTVLDTLPAQVGLLDQQGKLVVVNRSWRQYFEEYGDLVTQSGVGHSYLTLCEQSLGLPKSMSGRMVAGIHKVLRGETTQFVFEYHVGAGNQRRWFKTIVVSLVTNGGTYGGVVMNVDISQFHQTEELLHQREQEFRALAEHSPDLIARYDIAGVLLYANPAHKTLVISRLRSLIGKPVDAIWGSEAGEQWKDAIRQIVLRGSSIEQIYCKLQHQDAVRVFHVFMVPEYFRGSKKISSVLAVARDITATYDSERRLRESHERLREFAAETELVREDEKRHIARELHDELGQLLTALRMEIGMIKFRYAEQVPLLVEETGIMLELMDRTIKGVREIISDLRPNVLDMGMVAALEWLSHDFTRLYGIPCIFRSETEGIDLDTARATILFRIAQESLTNVAKHANASAVDVTLAVDGDNLRLMVRDNGRGISDIGKTDRRTFGLTGMSERAIALGGVLDILIERGKGTCIIVNIPIQNVREAKRDQSVIGG